MRTPNVTLGLGLWAGSSADFARIFRPYCHLALSEISPTAHLYPEGVGGWIGSQYG